MIQENYVSYETAKLLKEKGFYQDFLSEITPVWKLNGNRTELAFYGCDNYPCEIDEWYSAPTLQMAMKWIREVHNLYIDIFVTWRDKTPHYQWSVDNLITQDTICDTPCLEKYEEACEAVIKYCLENLI